jgi:glycosyltransferase involved in cell wall biosynthesis
VAKLSVFIIAKDEAKDLPGCLESVRGLAEEIVLVDSGSSDATPEIARAAGAKVLRRAFDGFAAQKQFALEQTTGEWAFSIDADERVTPALAAEIHATLRQPQADGYEISREMYFLGRRLRFGGVGKDRVLRLFRRPLGRFRRVKVHESIQVEGVVSRLQAPLQHLSYATIEEYVEKANHYTTLGAQDLWSRGRRPSWTDHLRPGWEVFSRAVLKGAALDGEAGWTYAALSGHTAWLRAIKLRELARKTAERGVRDAG